MYDASAWPVLQFRFSGRMNAAEHDQYFSDADWLLSAPAGFTCVLDGVAMQMPEVELVRRQSSWIRQNSAAIRSVNRGFALVAPSAVIRGMVRAVLHIQPLPVPYAVFAELDEGIEWARQRATIKPSIAAPRR